MSSVNTCLEFVLFLILIEFVELFFRRMVAIKIRLFLNPLPEAATQAHPL
jgi:hypothetical protein